MTTKVSETDKIPFDADQFVSDDHEERVALQKTLVKKVKGRFEEYGSAINSLIDSEHDQLHPIDGTNDHEGVSGATENNFVSFDANGLPKDSGCKDTDYAAAVHAAQHKTGGSDILYVPHRYVWHFPGAATVKTHEVIFRVGSQNETATGVLMTVATGNEPSGCSLIADVFEDGVSIFTTPPEIDAGGTEEDGNEAFSDTTLAADAQITCAITQKGSANPGEDLTVILLVKEPVV